jgi:hypothetical protein
LLYGNQEQVAGKTPSKAFQSLAGVTADHEPEGGIARPERVCEEFTTNPLDFNKKIDRLQR